MSREEKKAPKVEIDPSLLQLLIKDLESNPAVQRYLTLMAIAVEYNRKIQEPEEPEK